METVAQEVEPKAPTKKIIRQDETGTRTVYLRLKPIGGHLPKEIQAEAVRKLCSVFHLRQPLRGLTDAEEKKYLNGLLEVSPTHADWDKHTRRFWAELRVPVGFAGKPLEVGLNESGDPINVLDWITWRFAKAHPLVAADEAGLNSGPRKQFYLLDPSKDALEKNMKIQVHKNADRQFVLIGDKPDRMREALQLMLPTQSVYLLSDQDVENALFDQKNKFPDTFLKIVTDEELPVRAEITKLIAANIILKTGTTYTFRTDTIANTEAELIAFFKSTRNNAAISQMRALYKEALR